MLCEAREGNYITEKQYTLITKLYTSIRVCTQQQGPVHSSHIHEDAALWLTYNGCRSSAYTPAERVESHKSCRVKSLDAACFIFISQTPVIGRGRRNGGREAYSFR